MTWSNGCSVTSSLWLILFILCLGVGRPYWVKFQPDLVQSCHSERTSWYLVGITWASTCEGLGSRSAVSVFVITEEPKNLEKLEQNALLIACLPPVFFIRHNKTKYSEVYSSRKYWVGLWQIKKCCYWTEILVRYCWPLKVTWLLLHIGHFKPESLISVLSGLNYLFIYHVIGNLMNKTFLQGRMDLEKHHWWPKCKELITIRKEGAWSICT